MNISRRTRLVMVGSLILLLLLLLIWLWVFLTRPSEPVVVTLPEDIPNVELNEGPTPAEQQLAEQQEQRTQAASLTTVAKTFVARFGSYSHEAQFQNLIDLFPMMTSEMQAQTEQYIATTKLPETYYGVTTRVVTVTVESQDETAGVAVVRVQTQREIAEGAPQNSQIIYQPIVLELKKEAGVWNVHSAQWLES